FICAFLLLILVILADLPLKSLINIGIFDVSVALYSAVIPIIYLLELRSFTRWARSNPDNPTGGQMGGARRRRGRRARLAWRRTRRVGVASEGDTVTAVPTAGGSGGQNGGSKTGVCHPAPAGGTPKPLRNLVGERLNPEDKTKETNIYFVQL